MEKPRTKWPFLSNQANYSDYLYFFGALFQFVLMAKMLIFPNIHSFPLCIWGENPLSFKVMWPTTKMPISQYGRLGNVWLIHVLPTKRLPTYHHSLSLVMLNSNERENFLENDKSIEKHAFLYVGQRLPLTPNLLHEKNQTLILQKPLYFGVLSLPLNLYLISTYMKRSLLWGQWMYSSHLCSPEFSRVSGAWHGFNKGQLNKDTRESGKGQWGQNGEVVHGEQSNTIPS